MILKKTEMKEMPKSCLDCLNVNGKGFCKFTKYPEQIKYIKDKMCFKRYSDCPLVDPLKIRYKAERLNGDSVKGFYLYSVKKNKHYISPVIGLYIEIKPETLRVVVEE
jgi:hypothetical protein